MSAYYNEIDPQKAAWLRELISRGLIAPGDVDERSIVDVRPDDLGGYTQCHFFAGIGIWSYALRLAGWPDDRAVWTGSCPCPSFSAAGKGQGFDDPRHLWPNWFGLTRERRPPVVFGEQVDDAIGHGWLDLVQTDLEGEAYAVGKAVLGACSVGAPHIRQRLYFCADTADARRNDPRQHRSGSPLLAARSEQHGETLGGPDAVCPRGQQERRGASGDETADGRARWDRREPNSDYFAASNGKAELSPESLHAERWPLLLNGLDGRNRQDGRRQEAHGQPGARGEVCTGERPDSDGRQPRNGDVQRGWQHGLFAADCGTGESCDPVGNGSTERMAGSVSREEGNTGGAEHTGSKSNRSTLSDLRNPSQRRQSVCGCPSGIARYAALTGATRGFWADCDWWYGRDGKWRPIEPGLFPLAHGAPARVGRLRGYGDGIIAQVAAEFIKAYRILDAERSLK